ncbi:hypothetical protein ABIE67_009436 [Streptomyces sp. V4I8]|uniref:hypothetical protein n=1 Tax=Streptomyces sp. V4I8 TaxID=3156469 RepID=UPI0035137633
MNTSKTEKNWWETARGAVTSRGMVLTILGAVTLGVAILSMYVSFEILYPRFSWWAAPTVGALDCLWVVMQATEILAGNNKARGKRVRNAGLALTAINAAIPTADLIMNGHGEIDLAVILTPIAIVATKVAWWIALPSLGRKVSAGTQQHLEAKRQEVADRLEEMEAEASHRIELLELATELEERVAAAETAYRKSQLKIQQTMTEKLHQQAQNTEKTVAEKVLPASVAAIRLPELGTWTPTAPALPVTADRDASDAGSPALPGGRDASGTVAGDRHAGQGDFVNGRDGDRHAGRDGKRDAVTLAELAVVAGVPTPQPGEPLTDGQLDVVLRHLRYSDDPPLSYRQAGGTFRERGFVGSEERVRRSFRALLSNEETGEASDDSESDEEPEDAAS